MGWRAAPGRGMIRTAGGERDGQQGGRRGTTTSEIASRAFDVVVAGLVLLVVWPVLAAVVPAIRLTMGSPVLFRHERAGGRGATFEVKFPRRVPPSPATTGPTCTRPGPGSPGGCCAPPASTSFPPW
jgi:Bacterial sugar transferase